MTLSPEQQQLIATYLSTQPVVRAYVFGSYSRGEATPESDIDLLVELDYQYTIGLEFVQMQLDLQTLLARKVDLVSARGLSRHIRPLIEHEKQLVYAR